MRRSESGELLGFAERLLAVRRYHRLRQRDVAEALGIARETVVRIEGDYVANDRLREKIRHWLEEQEAAIDRELAALEREREAMESEGEAEEEGVSMASTLARMALRRRVERAYRVAARGRLRKGRGGRLWVAMEER